MVGVESDVPFSAPNLLGAGEREGRQVSEPQWLQVEDRMKVLIS